MTMQRLFLLLVLLLIFAGCGSKPATQPATSGQSGTASIGSPGAVSDTRTGWEARLDQLEGFVVPQGDDKQVRWLAWASNDKLVFSSGSNTEAIRLPEEVLETKLPGGYSFANARLMLPKQNVYLVAKGFSPTIEVYDATTLRPKPPINVSSSAESLAVSPDGLTVAAGLESGKIALFGVDSLKLSRELDAFDKGVDAVAFFADGRLAAIAGEANKVKVFDAERTAVVRELEGDFFAAKLQLLCVGESLVAAFDSNGSDVTTWDLAKAAEPKVLKNIYAESPLILIPGGKRAAYLDHTGYLVTVDFATGEKSGKVQMNHLGSKGANRAPLALSPDGTKLASAGTVVRIWNIETLLNDSSPKRIVGEELFSLNVGGGVAALAITGDGKTLVGGGFGGQVKLWNLPEFEESHSIAKEGDSVKSLALSADDKHLAVLYGYKSLIDLDMQSRTVAAEFDVTIDNFGPSRVAFANDARIFVTRKTDAAIYLPPSEEPIRTFREEEEDCNYLAISPDAKWLVTGRRYGESATIWNVEQGTVESTIELKNDFADAAFSPNGKLLAIGDRSGVQILEVGEFTGNRYEWGDCDIVAFTRDSKTLVYSEDGTLYLYDANSGAERDRLIGHSASVNSIVFTPDGKQAITGGGDGTVKVWKLP